MIDTLMDIPYALPTIVAFVVALLGTVAFTPLARIIACKIGAVDMPGPRRVNKVPIPRMGGVGVFAGMILAMLVVSYGIDYLGWQREFDIYFGSHIRPYWYVFSLGIMFATGVVDDKFHLSPVQKIVGQTLAASVATFSGLRLSEVVIPFGGILDLGPLAYPATIVFLVAYTNMFNLIDGLDGLAPGIAHISSFTMFVVAAMAGRMDAAMQSMILCGATLGFLVYNFHPASIFLGDSGSLLIGFTMGCISLMSVSRMAGLTTILVPLVIAGIPIIDTLSAIIRRKKANVSIGQADRGHLHHRLMEEGYNQKQAVLFVYAWTAFLCLGAVTMTQIELIPRIGVFIVLVGMSVLMVTQLQLLRPAIAHRDRQVRREERRHRHESRQRRIGERQEPSDSHGQQDANGETEADETDADGTTSDDGTE